MLLSLALVQISLGPSIDDLSQIAFKPIASGLDSPIHAAYVSGEPNYLYVVEREGKIYQLDLEAKEQTTKLVFDIENKVDTKSERGLLAIAFPPDAKNHHLFYAHYNDEDGTSILSRFKKDKDWVEEILFVEEQPWANHNGGQICFGPDGALYLGLGDGGAANDPHNNGQNLGTFLGAILRFDLETENPEPEMWHWGLRNPWRFSFDRKTGDMWIGDVGQNKWEEIDFAKAGEKHLNFGWRWREGRHDFNPPNETVDVDWRNMVREPAFEYEQDGNPRSCSVTGGFVYRGSELGNNWQGHYFFGDWNSGIVWSGKPQLIKGATVITKAMEHQELNVGFGLASFAEDAHGELYLINMPNGTISKLKLRN